MATNRILQLLRSKTLYESLDAAKIAIRKINTASDGEVRLARYQTSEGVKSLLCVYHTNENFDPALEGTITNMPGWTFIEDAQSGTDGIHALQTELDHLEAQVGQDGASENFTSGAASGSEAEQVLKGAQSGGTAPTNLTNAVTNVATYITTLDKAASAVDGQVVTTVTQTNGKVTETKANVKDLQLGGYTKDANASGTIGSTDTVNTALSKLENNIAANDTARTVVSSDQSITVGTVADGANAGKTDVIVNVDNATIVKDGTSGAIKSALKVIKVIPSGTAGTDVVVDTTLGTNVKEAYRLVYNGSITAIGQQVNVYKDSALQEVYLGASTDTVDASTGTITKNAVTDPQSMNFVYQLADGTYSITKIDVSKFLTDSEFGDGLQVSDGVVSVKKDTSSGKVRTAADVLYTAEDAEVIAGTAQVGDVKTSGLVDVLTVSSNGVKVDNIQGAINYAVQNASSDLAVSAQGDNYITAAVDANNNKKINVTADVQALTATAGTAGTYDQTTGAQTTAPTHGALTGVADSLADSSDIATKVKTYVDGEIAIEAARADAQVQAEKNRATTAENNIDTAVGLTSHAYVAPSKTNYLDNTTSVMNALSALDTAAGNGLDQVNGSNAIDVTTKANKAQTISLILDGTTQGNGHENTGTDNALTITNNGLFLSTTWDCGVY